MSDLILGIKEALLSAIQYFKNIVSSIVDGILNFATEILGYFRGLNLDQTKHTPFIGNQDSFKQALKNAPVKNVGIFQGVYNDNTDEIENLKYIQADSLDQQTRSMLENDELVVLS